MEISTSLIENIDYEKIKEDNIIENEKQPDDQINKVLEDEIICSTSKLKKRTSVEFNGMELVCALVLVDRSIFDFNNLISNIESNEERYANILKFNSKKDFYEYVKDIHKKKNIINNYIINFKNEIEQINSLSSDNIKKIYISGKINKHPEINILNDGVCKLEAKSDVYIELNDDTFIGLSVKQSIDATKSNYSVQKILGKENDKLLTSIKKNFLKEQGFPKHNKIYRDQVNALFYPQNKENSYMNRLKEEIENNKDLICNYLIEKIFCSNINYDVYEFNSIKLIKLTKEIEQSRSFEEYSSYYYDKKGNERKTAKLFYKLTYNNKIYRVEVRWKGNIHNASPQFQIHEE